MKLPQAEFERLAVEQLDAVYRMARRLVRDPARAEDLVQETYLRALKSRHTFEYQEHGIKPWLMRILYNLHLTQGQRESRQPRALEDGTLQAIQDKGVADLPIDPRSLEAMDEQLLEAVESLPEEYRSVLLLWAVEELSYQEIADVLGIPIGTVMSRLHRTRQRLAGQLREYATRQGLIRE